MVRKFWLEAWCQGIYRFYNLSAQLKGSDADFEDVWDVISFKGAIFFQNRRQFIITAKATYKAYGLVEKKLNYLGIWKDQLVLQDGDNNPYNSQ